MGGGLKGSDGPGNVHDEETVCSLSEFKFEFLDDMEIFLSFTGMDDEEGSSTNLVSLVGRPCGKLLCELQFFSGKLVHYDTSSTTLCSWKVQALFSVSNRHSSAKKNTRTIAGIF